VVGGPERRSNAAAWAAAAAAGQVVDAPHLDTLAEALARALALGPRPAPAAPAAADLLPRLPAPRPPPERPRWPVLAPLAPLVAGAAARRRSWAGPVERVGAPVVSVGALTAGGAGKTPVVAFLAEQLPGAWVVARGYGRALNGPALRVGRPGEAPSAPLGDELELLRRRGVPVVSCPDRVAGARAAVEAGARIVLLDDAFGHRRLHRDVDLVCVDTRWPTGGGPLPAGLGREPWSALERATHLWLLHGLPVDRPLPPRPTARARLVPAGWLRFGERLPLDALRGPVHAACGIARPEAFFTELVDLGLPIQGWTVRADHAPLGPLPPGAVVTEKDAARLPPGADVWALQLRLEVDEVGQALVGALRAHIGGGPP
jgi:tetraacyldisaccharide 4'-kinase